MSSTAIPVQSSAPASADALKDTLHVPTPAGQMVVDVWRARAASGAAPILLVHGWGGTGSYWKDTAALLSATTTVIVPDLPGTGRSQPVRRAQNMYDQVRALRDLLDYLELERVQVVGHSMGSAMALLLTEAQPERIERLVLTSLSFFVTESQQQIYRVFMSAFALTMLFRPSWLENVPAMWRMMAARYFYRMPDDEAVLRQGWSDYLRLDYGTAMACAKNAADDSIPKAGANVRAPTLLIACRQDQVMPVENVEYTARTIPNCELVWIDQCGHMPMIEQPDMYHAHLRRFLGLA